MEDKINEPASQRLDNLDRDLDKYCKKIGVSDILPPSDINFYLNLQPDQIAAMSPEQCSEAAYMLFRFSLHLQREQNRHLSRKLWADANIRILVGRQLSNYSKFDKYEQKLAAIITSDSSVRSLSKIALEEEIYSNEINFLSKTISHMAEILKKKGEK